MTDVQDDSGRMPAERTVSIGTWNMDHWRRTAQQRRDGWDFLRTVAKADVMLLQESAIPSDIPRDRYVHREIAGNRPWGSSVVALGDGEQTREIDTVRTRYGATRFSMLGSHPGAVIVARTELPDVGPITCVSVYGLINVYSQTTMFRIIADLIPLFDSRDGERVVLGGDFNVTTATKAGSLELPRCRAILHGVESLGLVNLATCDVSRPDPIADCPCADPDCRHLRTFDGNPGTQLDWLYATPELARRCLSLRVHEDVFGTLSDHAPVIAEFRLGPAQGVRVVDPDSFLEELGLRAGPECARVAEDLLDWAQRKHGELDAAGPRLASLDRFPTTSGDVPELWVQLDLTRPQGLQYTFSLRADGQLVIQFQYMTSPFDDPDARERLWTKLSQVPGFSLDRRLTGRPSVRLDVLNSADRLESFKRTFSEMIDETIRTRIV